MKHVNTGVATVKTLTLIVTFGQVTLEGPAPGVVHRRVIQLLLHPSIDRAVKFGFFLHSSDNYKQLTNTR